MHNFEEFLREYGLLPREMEVLLPTTNEGVLQKLGKPRNSG